MRIRRSGVVLNRSSCAPDGWDEGLSHLADGWPLHRGQVLLKTDQQKIADALEEERRLRFRSLLFRVEHCERHGDVFKLIVDPLEETSSLDETLEGSAATWSSPNRGHANIL